MKKIASLFQRNYDGDRRVRDEVVPGSEWVIEGGGIATVKIDGTSCLVRSGQILKRYDAKHGKPPPTGFEPAQDPDPITGHWPGWVPIGDEPDSKWHREAAARYNLSSLPDGTYELVGPKVQGNPYRLDEHDLVRHGDWQTEQPPPRDFSGLQKFFASQAIEGIVWHHPDGRMVKIKRRDFGFTWPQSPA